jgi:hypothetical protein
MPLSSEIFCWHSSERFSAGWILESLEELNSAGTENKTLQTVLINP